MKNLTLSQKTDLLQFLDGTWGYFLNVQNNYGKNKQLHKSHRLTKEKYTKIVNIEIFKISNVEREIEAMNDSFS